MFARIEADLRARILRNQLPPGSKLPSEAELEAHFGVSRITVRQALAELRAGGLIQKINGKGSFVTRAGDAPSLGPLTGFYEHMRAKGRKAHGRILSSRRVGATAATGAALRVARGAPLMAVKMLRLVDKRPLAVGTAWGEVSLMQALLREDVESNDMLTLLESPLGHRLACTHVESSAVRAGKSASQLELQADDPVLHMRFVPHDVGGKPLLYAEMLFRGDAFSYKAIVKR